MILKDYKYQYNMVIFQVFLKLLIKIYNYVFNIVKIIYKKI